MGVGGLITGIMGATDSGPKIGTPNPKGVSKDYLALINGFSQGQPAIFGTEQEYKPKYLGLDAGLLPQAVGAARGAVPGVGGLYDTLNNQAQQGLDAGTSLDPTLQATAQQSIRQGQAARGMGNGPADVLQESRAITGMGEQLRQRRQDFAAGLGSSETNAFLPAGMGLLGGANSSIIPGSQSYDIFNTAYNARAAANIGNANNQTALLNGFNSFD